MLMRVPPSRDSRATSSLRIDQQPATTSALVQLGPNEVHNQIKFVSRGGQSVADELAESVIELSPRGG
jgi:hypothetical protein